MSNTIKELQDAILVFENEWCDCESGEMRFPTTILRDIYEDWYRQLRTLEALQRFKSRNVIGVCEYCSEVFEYSPHDITYDLCHDCELPF